MRGHRTPPLGRAGPGYRGPPALRFPDLRLRRAPGRRPAPGLGLPPRGGPCGGGGGNRPGRPEAVFRLRAGSSVRAPRAKLRWPRAGRGEGRPRPRLSLRFSLEHCRPQLLFNLAGLYEPMWDVFKCCCSRWSRSQCSFQTAEELGSEAELSLGSLSFQGSFLC